MSPQEPRAGPGAAGPPAAGGYAMLAVAMLFLACNHVIGRGVRADIPPLGLNFWRWLTAALILAPLVLPRIGQSAALFRSHWRDVTLLGVLMTGSTGLIFVALNFTTAVNVSLLNAIQPALTVVLARIFVGEMLSARQGLGVLAAVAGVVVMITKADWNAVTHLQLNSGDLIALASMLGFSVYAINLRRLPLRLGLVEGLFWIIVSGSLALLPFYLLETVLYRPMPFTARAVVVVVILAILVSVSFNLLWNAGNQRVGPARAAVFINLVPLFGAVLAVTFLGEELAVYHLAGAALICSGIWFVIRGR
ncbi:MAG: DMT family transporter [Gammaproteobacteria bacterium]|nr:DMT family transporter [Gammaproteobacteria bacterium]